MKLLFQEELIDINEKNFNEKMEYIERRLHQSGLMFSHFLISGNPYYGTFEEAFENFKNSDTELEIICITEEEWLKEIRKEGFLYIKRASPILRDLVEKIYVDPDEKVWGSLIDLSEGLHYLNSLFSHPKINDGKEATVLTIQDISKKLVEAIENKDTTLLADYIQYELLPLFDEMELILSIGEDQV